MKGGCAMNENWDRHLKERMELELNQVKMTEETDKRILNRIHQQINEESKIMRFTKKNMLVALAAAIAVTGTITAIAAGKIVALSGGSSPDDAFHTAAELEVQAEKKLGGDIYIAEALSDGKTFNEGYVNTITGTDETGNTVLTYPEVYVSYGEGSSVSLSAHRVSDSIPEDSKPVLAEENYKEITIRANEDQYLFLPPDVQPSEEDLKLQQEGRLEISYGSSEVERQAFRHVSWTKDGVMYRLFTFGDTSLEKLMGMAKNYIDEK